MYNVSYEGGHMTLYRIHFFCGKNIKGNNVNFKNIERKNAHQSNCEIGWKE